MLRHLAPKLMAPLHLALPPRFRNLLEQELLCKVYVA